MKLTLVDIYPHDTVARYLLSGYFLKAYLDKHWAGEKLNVEVLNFSENVKVEDLSRKLIENDADFIGYSCYIWNIEKMVEAIKKVKSQKTNSIHILGGPEISLQRIHSLSEPHIANFYVIGEGEKKLFNLLSYLSSKNEGLVVEPPKGIAYWENDELKYSASSCSDDIVDLDEIPSIYLSNAIDENLYKKQQVFLETQRGCKFKCKYCVYHKFLPSIKYYSIKRAIQELEYLIVDEQVTALRITDAIFTSDLNRAKEIVKHLKTLKESKDIRLPWIYWEFDYTSIDEEFIALTSSLRYREKILNTDELESLDRPQLYSDMLKDYTVINSIGVESFCDESLMAVGRRRIDIAKFKKFMELARKHNIVVKMDMILGLPFETLQTYFKGLEIILPFLKNTDHILNLHRLQILPGSELEELTDQYQIKYSRSAPHIVYSTNALSEAAITLGLRLSAVLSRIVNSPMRSLFFKAWGHSGENLRSMIEKIYGRICESKELAKSRLVHDKTLYDSYWNDEIYREIPTKFIDNLLRSY